MTKSNVRFRTEKSTASKCYTRKTQAEHFEMFLLFILSAPSVFMVCILPKNGKCLSHYLCPSPSSSVIRYLKKDCHKAKNLRKKVIRIGRRQSCNTQKTLKQLSLRCRVELRQQNSPWEESFNPTQKNPRRKKKKCRQ